MRRCRSKMPRYRARLTRHSTSGNAVHDFSFPFRRYVPLVKHAKTLGREFQIINVVTGKAVNLETLSFADHVETLALAARMVPGADGPSLYDLDLFSDSASRR